ncbi:MAG: TonB-dependent receptor [Methyloglobulus sp.]|nr:TonB-dependent receptor [Methyloglobulus sp.]
MKKILFSTLLLTGANAPTILAQTDPAQNSVDLPEMVVTATRSETPKKQLSAASTVYTRNDIERLQVKTLPELLRGTTGLDMAQNGGLGQPSSVFMRGTNSDHVLVLVDGIKVGSATLGSTPFQFVPIDQVERVEIIRGPQSSLYGSEAIGGVIQIFTRKGGDSEKPSFSLDAGGGSYDTYRTAGNVSGKWKNSWYSLGASSIGTEGINAKSPNPNNPADSRPNQARDSDRDGYQNTAMNARAGYRFDNNAEIEASFIRAEGFNEYDNAPDFTGKTRDNKAEFITQTVGISGKVDILDNWHSTLRLGQSRDESDAFFPNNTFDSRFNTTRWNATWLNEVVLTDEHKLILGSDYRLDEVESTTPYTENSRYDVGVFGEYHGQFLEDHFVNASVRWDKNEQFGEYVTGNVGLRSNWAYGISTFANFGNAFKAPSFNDLYYPYSGNPKLKPEESMSAEIGLAGNHENVQWELRAYHTNANNFIIWSPITPTSEIWKPFNVVAEIQGIEAEISAQLMGWNGKLSMNILSPESRETNTRLPSRADKTLSFDLSRSFGQFDVGANVLAQDHRFKDLLNSVQTAGYVTVGLRAAYHINKNWMLSAKLNNLLDKNYQTVDTYNQQGRNFFFTIHYNN